MISYDQSADIALVECDYCHHEKTYRSYSFHRLVRILRREGWYADKSACGEWADICPECAKAMDGISIHMDDYYVESDESWHIVWTGLTNAKINLRR